MIQPIKHPVNRHIFSIDLGQMPQLRKPLNLKGLIHSIEMPTNKATNKNLPVKYLAAQDPDLLARVEQLFRSWSGAKVVEALATRLSQSPQKDIATIVVIKNEQGNLDFFAARESSVKYKNFPPNQRGPISIDLGLTLTSNQQLIDSSTGETCQL